MNLDGTRTLTKRFFGRCPAPPCGRALVWMSCPTSATGSLLQVLVSLSCDRIEEAVTLDGAPTVVVVCENRKALEAELGHAAPAHHLVAFLPLCALAGDVLLAHAHLTLRALLGSRAFHPAHKAWVGGLEPY